MRSAVQGALALVLALLLPFTARAANDGEIRTYIIAINRLYESLEYELALSRIPLARKLPRGTDEEVTLSLYEGILLCELRRQGPGASAFRAALLLRPDAKLPVQVAPKVEALFESVRKQVKQEIAPFLSTSGAEKPSDEAEQEREEPAQVAKKEEPASPKPSAPTAQVAEDGMKDTPVSPAPSAPKAEPRKEEPVAAQTLASPDCTPEPTLTGKGLKEKQLSRLAGMKQTLCLSGKFQGLVSEKWMGLKIRMEGAATSQERTRLSQEIDQFASEFIYEDPRWEAERRKAEAERLEAERLEAERLEAERLEAERLEAKRLEAKRLEAERLEAERLEAERLEAERLEAERLEAERLEAERELIQKKLLDAANLDTSKCQPVVSVDCERELLLQRLRIVQQVFLGTNPSSKLPPLRELGAIGNHIRAAHTREQLGKAALAIDSWQQRQFPP